MADPWADHGYSSSVPLRERKTPVPGTLCFARFCRNQQNRETRQKGITFHKFPSKEKCPYLHKEWVRACGREGGREPGRRALICSEHFLPSDFDRTGQTTRLRNHVIPSVIGQRHSRVKQEVPPSTSTNGRQLGDDDENILVVHPPTTPSQDPLASLVYSATMPSQDPLPSTDTQLPTPLPPPHQPLSLAPLREQVEFQNALSYVQEIKTCFWEEPEVYKRFLEILQTYREGQRKMREEIHHKPITEAEVYSQVATLFQNQGHLMPGLRQFLSYTKSREEQVSVVVVDVY